MSTNVVTLHAIIDLALSLSFSLCPSFTLEYAGKYCRQALGDQTKLFGPRADDIDAERCLEPKCCNWESLVTLLCRKLAFHAPLFSSRNLMFVFVRAVPLVCLMTCLGAGMQFHLSFSMLKRVSYLQDNANTINTNRSSFIISQSIHLGFGY